MSAETLADILRDMRNPENDYITNNDLRDLADRIEAAAERDKQAAMKTALMAKCEICAQLAPQCNAAALRAALEEIDKNTDLLDIAEDLSPDLHPSHSFVAVQIRKIARAALSAPPRNCDVGTAEEQAKRFATLCNKYYDDENECDKRCPLAQMDFIHGFPRCQAFWAQMPYEAEEGAR